MRERRQVEVFALVAEAIERAVGYRPTEAHLGIALAVCDRPTESGRLLRSLPSDQDRSLVDVLVAFYHAGLMAGVHVVFPDQEHAEREAELYRMVAEELDASWQVELLAPEQRDAALQAHVTIGAVDEFHLDPGLIYQGLAIFRVEQVPERLRGAYARVRAPEPPVTPKLFLVLNDKDRDYVDWLERAPFRCPESAERRVAAIQELLGSPAPGFRLRFPDRETGERVAADRGLLEALLVKHDKLGLVGAHHFGAPTEDGGYEITFGAASRE